MRLKTYIKGFTHKVNDILKKQKNVKHLTYAIFETKSDYQVQLSNINKDVGFKFKKKDFDESACIAKILTVLLDMEKKEKWKIKRIESQD
jgi:hypothetical protein